MHARSRIRIHVCGDALRPTSRRTPRLLLAGDDDATNDDAGRRSRPSSRDMRSVREDFFLHVPNDSRETTHGRAVSYRAFVPKGRRVVLARSLVGGSFVHTFKGARTDTRVHGAVRSTGPVSFYRIAMSFPRVRDLECSRCESPRLVRLQRDETTRGDDASSIK